MGWLLLAAYLLSRATGAVAGIAPDETVAHRQIPANVEAGPEFRSLLESLLRHSPTFRRQCRRLAFSPDLPIRLLLQARLPGELSSGARTVFRFRGGRVTSADVYFRAPLDISGDAAISASELVAHEFEHILEQLEGVDLEVQAGTGVVWGRRNSVFETRRALETGRRVVREITGPAAAAPAMRGDDTGGRHVTVRQGGRVVRPASPAALSAGGRFVAFTSWAPLVEGDRNERPDLYVLDLSTGQFTLEEIGPGLMPSDGEHSRVDISEDGRYLTFEAKADHSKSHPGHAGRPEVFLRDRRHGVTSLLTRTQTGTAADGLSGRPAISADGTTVVFESSATDLIDSGGAVAGSRGVYLTRIASGFRMRIDTPADGCPAPDGPSMSPAVSGDGRFVVFASRRPLICPGAAEHTAGPADTNGVADVYLRDTQTNAIRRISRGHNGKETDGPSYGPAISGDGRVVAFVSEASNLIPGGTSRRIAQLYVHDLRTGRTELISRTAGGRPADGNSASPVLSFDGSRVAFQSLASDLLCAGTCQPGQADINLVWDVFLYDRPTGRTVRISADDGAGWLERSRSPMIDRTGMLVVFQSQHPIAAHDEHHDDDLYITSVDRLLAPHAQVTPERRDQPAATRER